MNKLSFLRIKPCSLKTQVLEQYLSKSISHDNNPSHQYFNFISKVTLYMAPAGNILEYVRKSIVSSSQRMLQHRDINNAFFCGTNWKWYNLPNVNNLSLPGNNPWSSSSLNITALSKLSHFNNSAMSL